MELNLFWTNFAQKELQQIFKYHKVKVSINLAQKIIQEIFQAVEVLRKFPKIRQKEELLQNRKETFRYLIYSNYKIIYWINTKEQQIEITDIFDTRQNPNKIQRSKPIT